MNYIVPIRRTKPLFYFTGEPISHDVLTAPKMTKDYIIQIRMYSQHAYLVYTRLDTFDSYYKVLFSTGTSADITNTFIIAVRPNTDWNEFLISVKGTIQLMAISSNTVTTKITYTGYTVNLSNSAYRKYVPKIIGNNYFVLGAYQNTNIWYGNYTNSVLSVYNDTSYTYVSIYGTKLVGFMVANSTTLSLKSINMTNGSSTVYSASGITGRNLSSIGRFMRYNPIDQFACGVNGEDILIINSDTTALNKIKSSYLGSGEYQLDSINNVMYAPYGTISISKNSIGNEVIFNQLFKPNQFLPAVNDSYIVQYSGYWALTNKVATVIAGIDINYISLDEGAYPIIIYPFTSRSSKNYFYVQYEVLNSNQYNLFAIEEYSYANLTTKPTSYIIA